MDAYVFESPSPSWRSFARYLTATIVAYSLKFQLLCTVPFCEYTYAAFRIRVGIHPPEIPSFVCRTTTSIGGSPPSKARAPRDRKHSSSYILRKSASDFGGEGLGNARLDF